MDSVKRELDTPYGAMLMYPAYYKHAFDGALAVCYNKGSKENSSIFSHSQGWLILAEALLGRGNLAYEYWCKISPATYNEDAQHRVIEPYAHGQTTEGCDSPYAGRSHVHWLTGTASTVMVASVEGILGLRPAPDGLTIDPSIPNIWTDWSMVKVFRGKTLNIKVKNPNGCEHGVKSIIVNGEETESNFISDTVLKTENDIVVHM